MAYGYYASITVDHTKVSGSADLTDFPVLVSGTYDGTGGEPDIRTVANGGKVQNAATGGNSGSIAIPADLAFFSDSAATTPLDFEIESYTASTGLIHAWVRIPTLDFNDNTVFYMHYGDAAVSTSQENVSGTWKTAYQGVYHFNGNVLDSTSNNRDGTNSGSTDSASGKIGNGRDLDGTNDYITFTEVNPLTSVHFWADADTNDNDTCFYHSANRTIQTVGGGVWAMWDGDSYDSTITGTLQTGSFNKYDFCWDGANYDYYKNGSYVEEHQSIDQMKVNCMGRSEGTGANGLNGRFDEIRFSTITNADWLATEYNTQNSPSTFYTMGSETAVGGGGAAAPSRGYMTPNKFIG